MRNIRDAEAALLCAPLDEGPVLKVHPRKPEAYTHTPHEDEAGHVRLQRSQ